MDRSSISPGTLAVSFTDGRSGVLRRGSSSTIALHRHKAFLLVLSYTERRPVLPSRIRGVRLRYPLVVILLITTGIAASGVSGVPVADADERAVAARRAHIQSTGNLSCRPGTGPRDPSTDRLGWERGCWYNESLDIRRADGLTEREVDALVARTMARIEVLRGLEFRIDLTVELRPRSSFDRGNRTVPRARVLRKNARFEALFLINESTDAVRYRMGIGGYYAYWDDRIVLVSENDTVETHEFKLAHELVHALQDDHFDSFNGSRRLHDRQAAKSALTEGTANYVVQDYKRRCRGAWNGTCFPPADWKPDEAHDRSRWCEIDDPSFNWGHHLVGIFPYSDGPPFVASLHERRGWAGVAAAYRRPPNSTEQVIHPAKYPTDQPSDITLRDRSRSGWQVIQPARDRRPRAFSMGEAAMYVMFWYQAFTTDHRAPIIPCRHAFHAGGSRDMYNYSHPITAGWDGDRLLPYVSTEMTTQNRTGSNELARTGYVWRIAWDRPRDAREFAAAYRDLLAAHDATAVSGRANTYRLPDASGFGDAFYLAVTNATVLIVNAPTVEDIQHLRPGAAPRTASPTQSSGRASGDFGALLAGVVILLAAVVLLVRRRAGQ